MFSEAAVAMERAVVAALTNPATRMRDILATAGTGGMVAGVLAGM